MRKLTYHPGRVLFAVLGIAATMTLLTGCEEGYALAIGLNEVDPAHYEGWNGKLYACERDAEDMAAIARSQHLREVDTLLTPQATRAAVLGKLDALARKLRSGDLLVVSYSGHGGQLYDENGDETDDDWDETWCLYDGQLIDDELHGAWMKFQTGVRILVFSDSCHSGTVIKMTKSDLEASAARMNELNTQWRSVATMPTLDRQAVLARPRMREAIKVRPELRERILRVRPVTPVADANLVSPIDSDGEESLIVARLVPPKILIDTYKKNEPFYVKLGRDAPKETPESLKASVILISGCKDPQASAEVGGHGLFTLVLTEVWNKGTFSGDHKKFHLDILNGVKQMCPAQEPAFFVASDPNVAQPFIHQRPYTIERP